MLARETATSKPAAMPELLAPVAQEELVLYPDGQAEDVGEEQAQ
jgi:hypothetical protein